jgi:hypothetical protein
MTIEAFKSRRVKESLKAINTYLDLAADLAGDVKPSQTLRLDLESAPVVPDVRVTEVLWAATQSKVIEVGKVGKTQKVKVSGEHLTHLDKDTNTWLVDVTVLKLVGLNSAGAFFEAVKFENPRNTGFEADLELVNGDKPQLGSYDVWAVGVTGQTDLLTDACSIEKDKAAPGPLPPAEQLQLGAMLPNILLEGRTAKVVLIVLKGKPDKDGFSVTTVDGKPDKGFSVKETARRPGRLGLHLTLEVKVPAVPAEQGFYLVATSSAAQLEDRLVFGVVPQSSTDWSGTGI